MTHGVLDFIGIEKHIIHGIGCQKLASYHELLHMVKDIENYNVCISLHLGTNFFNLTFYPYNTSSMGMILGSMSLLWTAEHLVLLVRIQLLLILNFFITCMKHLGIVFNPHASPFSKGQFLGKKFNFASIPHLSPSHVGGGWKHEFTI